MIRECSVHSIHAFGFMTIHVNSDAKLVTVAPWRKLAYMRSIVVALIFVPDLSEALTALNAIAIRPPDCLPTSYLGTYLRYCIIHHGRHR